MAPQCISCCCWWCPWPLSVIGTSGRSELGRTSCSRVPRRWQLAHDGGSHSSGTVEGTAAPTPAWSVPWCLEGLAGQAAGAGPRTGSCCCSCKSAISVGEAWWSGPLGLPQCLRLQTAPLHCFSASRQLLYTVSVPPDSSSTLSQCLQTSLHCPPVGVWLFYFQSCSAAPDL